MEEKKYFTFLNCNKCIGSNGSEFISVATCVKLSNFKQKEANGSQLTTARAHIANRSNVLSAVLGETIVPDEYGNVWVDVTFWGDKSERINKYLGDRETARVFLVGTMTSRTYKREDGTEGIGVTIRASDWASAENRYANAE